MTHSSYFFVRHQIRRMRNENLPALLQMIRLLLQKEEYYYKIGKEVWIADNVDG